MEMLRRRFGRTGIQMPVLSCGGMRYQQTWKEGTLASVTEENQRNLEETIRRAVSLGINHIETARGYGSSESQLGLVLPTFKRDSLIVQTKVSPSADPKEFRRNFEESLRRLKLPYVDLFSLHGVNDEESLEWSVRPGGCLEEARRIQKDGLARHIGFSTHAPLDVLMSAVSHDRDGGFDYVNLHWYFIYQKNWPAVLEATRRDMGVFIISPSDKGGMLYQAPQKLTDLTAPLHPIVFNDLYCLDRPEVHTLSIGAARPSDFDLHVEAVGLYEKRGEYLPAIGKRLVETMHAAVGRDFAERFSEGVPPRWQDIPGGINIHTIIWLLNLAEAYDLVEYAKMRYNLLGNAGHWFPGNTAEKLDQVDITPALKDSPFRDRLAGDLRRAHQLLYREPVKRLSES